MINVGLFVDKGARSNGWAAWIGMLEGAPELRPVYLDGAAIRAGALRGVDALAVPGGNSNVQGRSLGAEGRAELKAWIAGGGRYIGTCGGCSLLLNYFDEHLHILPFMRHKDSDNRGNVDAVSVRVTDRGEALTGIKAGAHDVCYHSSPLLVPCGETTDTRFEIIGAWDGDYVREGARSLSMRGLPALICAWHGEGKIFAATGHPEYYPFSRDIIAGGFRFITGVSPAFGKQPRSPGAKAVGFYTPSVGGIDDAEQYAALWRDPSVDVVPLMNDDIAAGRLDHIDELVIPKGDPSQLAAMPQAVAERV